MEELKFNSLKELYDRVSPALHSKVKELNKANIKYIKEEDIWNTLKETKWINCPTLTLADMVNDILNSDSSIFIEYIHKNIEKTEVEAFNKGDSII